MRRPVSVLVVDDSALMRNLISRIIASSPELQLAGRAMNGYFALQKTSRLNPEVIILDLEMPQMNGIEFLKERRKRGIKIPVIILSSLARKGAKITMEALALGASDFILKPSGSISEDIHKVGDTIIKMAEAYGRRYQQNKPSGIPEPRREAYLRQSEPKTLEIERPPEPVHRPIPWKTITPERGTGSLKIIVIGVSTGGPNALRKVLPLVERNIAVPIVVVQHMPAGFTLEFANSLNKICRIEVSEAVDNQTLEKGHLYIAPGDKHLELDYSPPDIKARISQMPHVNGHRPSVDVLFNSVARNFSNHSLAIIMTGMGKDGARGIGMIYREGSYTVAQDEESCIVYGMPKVAMDHEYITKQVHLRDLPEFINRYSSEHAE